VRILAGDDGLGRCYLLLALAREVADERKDGKLNLEPATLNYRTGAPATDGNVNRVFGWLKSVAGAPVL